MGYNVQLKNLMNDFDRSTDRLKEVLRLGGKISQEEFDYYNHTHTCIQETRRKIKELDKEENRTTWDDIYCMQCSEDENIRYVDNYGGWFLYRCNECGNEWQVEEWDEYE